MKEGKAQGSMQRRERVGGVNGGRYRREGRRWRYSEGEEATRGILGSRTDLLTPLTSSQQAAESVGQLCDELLQDSPPKRLGPSDLFETADEVSSPASSSPLARLWPFP